MWDISMLYIKAVHIWFAGNPACDNGAIERNPATVASKLSTPGGIKRERDFPAVAAHWQSPGRFHTRGYVQ